MVSKVLLVLPCNPCVRLGDYSLCSNWRVVLSTVGDLVEAGAVDMAAIDSCKPGIVPWGEEGAYRHCDIRPTTDLYYRREPWRREILLRSVVEDLKGLLTSYRSIVYYVNVKAYREALDKAAHIIGSPPVISAGPPRVSLPSYRSRRNRERLREILLSLASPSATTKWEAELGG
ncbi:MAG: hypothetical protein F7C35_01995 [Desulfurococcales archaeon]|nr:hypothetical protein [Desulfurococcales archaeon]